MSHPPIQVVDKEDNPIRGGTMDEVQQKGLFHRIVRVMIESPEGDILLQKRAKGMHMYPGCWDNSAAGHVDEGEDYIEAANREMQEEIGAETKLKEIEVYKTEESRGDKILNRFNGVFRGSLPKDTTFDVQESEVDEVRWFTRDEVKQLVKNNPDKISDGLADVMKRYY